MSHQRILRILAEAPAYLLPSHAASHLAAWLYQRYHQLFAARALHATTKVVQLTLAEPSASAAAIARACFAAKGRQRSNYRAMARQTTWPRARTDLPANVHSALADVRKPLVLLTLHQADYLAGLLAVLRLIPQARDIHIIKLAEWTRIEEDAYQHFRRHGHHLTIHRLSERPAKRIVRALRQGAILLTFVDVPREFGATVPVQMFGLPYQLTSGPLAMARLANGRVLPLFTHYEADGTRHVCSGPFIHSKTAEGRQSVPDMAQLLARQIETNLRKHGYQWEMWPVLDNLLDREALATGSVALAPDATARLKTLGARPSASSQ